MRIGDGRAGLAAADGRYALIVVDAFNSDAVTVHLLTREAVALFRRKLAPGGALLFNVTNDYPDLEAVVRVDDESVTVTAEIPSSSRRTGWRWPARRPTSRTSRAPRGGARPATVPPTAPGPTTPRASWRRSGSRSRA